MTTYGGATFNTSGYPSGGKWSIVVENGKYTSSTGTITVGTYTFYLPNDGSAFPYSYTITPPSGYFATPSTGEFYVSSTAVTTMDITFSQSLEAVTVDVSGLDFTTGVDGFSIAFKNNSTGLVTTTSINSTSSIITLASAPYTYTVTPPYHNTVSPSVGTISAGSSAFINLAFQSTVTSTKGTTNSSCPSAVTNPTGWIACVMQHTFSEMFSSLLPVMESTFGYVANPIESGIGDLGTALSNTIVPALSSLPTDIISKISPFLNTVTGDLSTVGSDLSTIPSTIKNGFKNVGSYISSGITNGLSTLESDIEDALAPLTSTFSNVFSTLNGYFDTLVSDVGSIPTDLTDIYDKIKSFVTTAVSFVTNFFTNVKHSVEGIFKTYVKTPITDFYKNTILPAVSYVKTNIIDKFLSDVKTFMKDFKSFIGVVASVGGDIITGVTDIGKDSVDVYNFLKANPYYLPNWAWILIGGVGAVAGVGAGVIYTKGYLTNLGVKGVLGKKVNLSKFVG